MNTLISKITASVLALSLTLISSSSLASSCGSYSAVNKAKTSQPKASAQQPKKAPSFMFVIDAKQGEIKKDKNGQYHLILKKVDMNQVILFSDRPQRIVKYITGKELQALWKEGKNSFEKDPPNAVLSGTGIKTEIVILNGIHVKKDAMMLEITSSTDMLKVAGRLQSGSAMSAVTLTIDSGFCNCCRSCIQESFCCMAGSRKYHRLCC